MTDDRKPIDVDSYIEWLRDAREVDLGDRYRTHYEHAMAVAGEQIRESTIWQNVLLELSEVDARFQVSHGSVLINRDAKSPVLRIKPYDSFVEKTYRLNVLRNSNWPNEPDDGWCLPPDWLSTTKDLVRTTIPVRYLDGVQLVLRSLERLCNDSLVDFSFDLEARSEGYYAAHAVIECECELPTMAWDTERRVIRLEVQIATVVQGVIRELLHRHYERRRVELKADTVQWQWQYDSDEFATNYMAHMSHYLDGMIVGLRDRSAKTREIE
jgi:ppGpp synthetase/RelA/SpoT-type nucleotidyltranferase